MALSTTGLHGKDVAIKLTDLRIAIKATVRMVEDTGIWLVGSDAANQIASAIPLPLGAEKPAFFVPYSQIAWLMTAEF